LRVYLTWITSTGYTYGALATPIAVLLFAFFLGFAIMLGAELNAAIREEWPAPVTHAKRFRWWLEDKRSRSTETRGSPRNRRPPSPTSTQLPSPAESSTKGSNNAHA
jgi:membrane protein